MATLSKQVKLYVVERLACFDSPTEVAKQVADEFGVKVDANIVKRYDASKDYIRSKMSEELSTLFDKRREEFRTSTDGIAIANKAHRLKMLDRMAREAEAKGNKVLAAALIEQAAKECGEHYTNRRLLEHTGKNGAALPGTVGVFLSDTDAAREIADILDAARARAGDEPPSAAAP